MLIDKAQVRLVKELAKSSYKAGFYKQQSAINGAVAVLAVYGWVSTVIHYKIKEHKQKKATEQPETENTEETKEAAE